MRRTKRGLAILALSLGILIACDAWSVWDDVFNRSSVGASTRGWTGGDGAISAELPNNRAFWIFGDSLITSYDAQGQRPQAATQNGHLGSTAFGNTIAVQSNRTSPSASSIAFWGRKTNGKPRPITTNVNEGIGMFFSKASLGLPATSPETVFNWPQGAECVNCAGGANARLLLAFAKFGATCDPHPSGSTVLSCIPACSLSGGSDGSSCHSGVQFLSSVVTRIKGIDKDPAILPQGASEWVDQWSTDGAPLELLAAANAEPVMWGTAFVDTGSGTWIFGRRIRTGQNPVTTDLVVAKAASDVLSLGSWQYWHGTSGWTSSSSNLVAVATKVGALNSVDKITRGTTTRYLLVHGDVDHLLYARVSDALSGSNPPTWPAPAASTPRIDLVSIEFSLFYQMLDLINRGKCTADLSGSVPNYSSCGLVYHGLGHAYLAVNDTNGQPLYLPASYVVPNGPNPLFNPALPEGPDNARTGVVNATYYRPKFTVVQLDKLKPWCTTDCWEGIVHDHAPRQLGSQPVTYAYDVRSSTRFYAALSRTSGAASLRVDFYNGLSLLSGQTCAQVAGSPSMLACNLSKPANATTAIATVSGASTDVYGIRTHYAGFY